MKIFVHCISRIIQFLRVVPTELYPWHS
uniref:Uncharacterized protein n=1 Tax=Anguilla anguilla TaxID=7936 RepID=A0A0E9VAW5_ANGAN